MLPDAIPNFVSWYIAEKSGSQVWTEFSILSLYIVIQHSAWHPQPIGGGLESSQTTWTQECLLSWCDSSSHWSVTSQRTATASRLGAAAVFRSRWVPCLVLYADRSSLNQCPSDQHYYYIDTSIIPYQERLIRFFRHVHDGLIVITQVHTTLRLHSAWQECYNLIQIELLFNRTRSRKVGLLYQGTASHSEFTKHEKCIQLKNERGL